MELDKLGAEMKETGTQVLLSVDPESGDFRAEVTRGNEVVMESSDVDLTGALREILPEGSIDHYYCGWSVEDVHALEPSLSFEDARGVLQLMSRKGDANSGFAWDTLTSYIELYRSNFQRGCEAP